jgi:hypothetical protein
MNQSASIKNLAEALAKAQSTLKNPHFDATNPHFKSKFASLGAVRDAVVPVFSGLGLSLSQWPVSEEGKAGCRTLLAHASGEWLEECFLIPVDKHNAHGYASAVTYSKRIAMQSIAGVVGEEDDDGNAAVGDNVKGERKPEASTISAKKEAFDRMPSDEQMFLRGIAANVTALIEEDRAYDAYGYWINQKLDTEEMVAIQHLWNSKERSALTKASEQWKLANKPSTRGDNHQGASPQSPERQAA